MSHANATLTPAGRLKLARLVVDQGWSLCAGRGTVLGQRHHARRWAARYRHLGAAGMGDRSSRPRHCPHQLDRRTERRIVALRFTRRWGRTGSPTIWICTARPSKGPEPLPVPAAELDRPGHRDPDVRTRQAPLRARRTRGPGPRRHQEARPDPRRRRLADHGAGRPGPTASRTQPRSTRRRPAARGYAYLHHAVDDHSRLAYSEILDDERKETAAAFWERASGSSPPTASPCSA